MERRKREETLKKIGDTQKADKAKQKRDEAKAKRKNKKSKLKGAGEYAGWADDLASNMRKMAGEL